MTIQVTGLLKDSSGAPSPNTPISLLTIKGADGVLPSASFDTITDSDGNYDFNINIGIHFIAVRYDTSLEKVGKATVNNDTPSPINIETLLSFEEPLLPTEIIQVQQLVAEANAAAQSASEDAAQVATDKQEVAENTQTTQVNADAVADSRQQIDTWQQEVADNTLQVEQDTQIVLNAQTDVTEKSQQVSDDAAQVAQDKSDTSTSAANSKLWAVGQIGSGTDTPSDTNNSYYWSMQALSNANQTFVSGGQFDPSAGSEYPDVVGVERDTIWLVNLPSVVDSYIYTTGVFAGMETNSGDMIFYDTPADEFILIPTTIKSPEFLFERVEYTAASGETVFSVPTGYIAQSGLTQVLYNGVVLSINSYSITDSGETVTLNDAVDSNGDIVTLMVWNKVGVSNIELIDTAVATAQAAAIEATDAAEQMVNVVHMQSANSDVDEYGYPLRTLYKNGDGMIVYYPEYSVFRKTKNVWERLDPHSRNVITLNGVSQYLVFPEISIGAEVSLTVKPLSGGNTGLPSDCPLLVDGEIQTVEFILTEVMSELGRNGSSYFHGIPLGMIVDGVNYRFDEGWRGGNNKVLVNYADVQQEWVTVDQPFDSKPYTDESDFATYPVATLPTTAVGSSFYVTTTVTNYEKVNTEDSPVGWLGSNWRRSSGNTDISGDGTVAFTAIARISGLSLYTRGANNSRPNQCTYSEISVFGSKGSGQYMGTTEASWTKETVNA